MTLKTPETIPQAIVNMRISSSTYCEFPTVRWLQFKRRGTVPANMQDPGLSRRKQPPTRLKTLHSSIPCLFLCILLTGTNLTSFYRA